MKEAHYDDFYSTVFDHTNLPALFYDGQRFIAVLETVNGTPNIADVELVLGRAVEMLAAEARKLNSKKTLFYHCHNNNRSLRPDHCNAKIFKPDHVKIRVYTYTRQVTYPNRTGDISSTNTYCIASISGHCRNYV
ncbi:uncharacterized protein [Bemisia tabaci]|uniref:uncharacterized protein n=1 Tax=Bemisia tabaci TaxID=7038 RepID=UPI003B2873C9